MENYFIRNFIYSNIPLLKMSCPIIVAGMPKSGTTAIASLLGQAIDAKISSDPFHRLDTKGVKFRNSLFGGEISIKKIWKTHREIFDGGVVKDPNFPFFLDELTELFPGSRVVFIVREPKQNIRSILNRLNLDGNPGNFEHLNPNLPTGWKNLLIGSSPDMPGHDYLERMAWRWRTSAEMYQKNRNKILLVKYEDFNIDKHNYIAKIAREVGYKRISDISRNLDVQFQPKGQTRSDWENYFGEDGLKRITKIVAPVAKDFGYE